MNCPNLPPIVTLRLALQQIDDQIALPLQRGAVERLSGRQPHALRLIEESTGAGGPQAYNCFMYALDLCGLDESLLRTYERQALQLDIGSEFSAGLVNGGLDSIADEERAPGTIAIYFNLGGPVHAGLLMPNGLVQSKWGMGHLWQHDLFELRADYGERKSGSFVGCHATRSFDATPGTLKDLLDATLRNACSLERPSSSTPSGLPRAG